MMIATNSLYTFSVLYDFFEYVKHLNIVFFSSQNLQIADPACFVHDYPNFSVQFKVVVNSIYIKLK